MKGNVRHVDKLPESLAANFRQKYGDEILGLPSSLRDTPVKQVDLAVNFLGWINRVEQIAPAVGHASFAHNALNVSEQSHT
ncbi:MAG TPA: hypothetical protein PLW86_17610, partial [Rhodocyclaceae bacterium]|nr:hypothetical protein [Rhodocyclaceae bacterium]